jgi:glycerol-3-phosphate dehydrogenase
MSNVLDAKEHGGRVFNQTVVTSLIVEQERVVGVRCYNTSSNLGYEIYAREVINAAGIWGQNICEYADLSIKMFPAKGALLILDYRINNLVINRCRKPSNADILVPGDTISLIGTTSERIPYSQIDQLTIRPNEVDTLLHEGSKLAPIMKNTRVLRAYAGVRPLVSLNGDESGRDISRGIVLVDHAEKDGLEGLTTITGGKLMTYRLMAEQATDLVASKLNNNEPCHTATKPLPGSAKVETKTRKTASIAKPVYESACNRHGERALTFLKEEASSQSIVCECEMVTVGEVEYAIKQLDVKNIEDLRRRTRLGMGPCQGELCTYRAAGLFSEYSDLNGVECSRLLVDFVEERWKGTKPVMWGDALREAEFSYWVYEGLLGTSELNIASQSLEKPEYESVVGSDIGEPQ